MALPARPLGLQHHEQTVAPGEAASGPTASLQDGWQHTTLQIRAERFARLAHVVPSGAAEDWSASDNLADLPAGGTRRTTVRHRGPWQLVLGHWRMQWP